MTGRPRRVAITGLGLVTPLGNDVASTWQALVDGRSGAGEITQFDECMYTVGVQQRSGYLFRNRRGEWTRRTALAFDLRGSRLPAMSVMATSGEEPPQIECNEDASGQGTDE